MSLLGAIGLSGGFGLANAGLSYLAQREANKAMLQANKDTNEMNYKIWQEQLAWNRDNYNQQVADNRENWLMQFNTTNAYNDPSAQVARFEEAGLNPFLMMNGQGSVASAGSGIAPGQMQGANPPTMQAPPTEAFKSPLMTGLQQGFQSAMSLVNMYNSLIESQHTQADTALKKFEVKKGEMTLPLEMQKMSEEINNAHLKGLNLFKEGEKFDLENRFLRDTMESRQKALNLANDYQDVQLNIARLEYEKQEILMEYFEDNQIVAYQRQLQQLANDILEGKVKEAEAEELLSRASANYAEAAYKRQQVKLNRPAEILAEATDDLLNSNGYMKAYDQDDPDRVTRIVPIEDALKTYAYNYFYQIYYDAKNKAEHDEGRWTGYINFMSNIGDGLRGFAGGLVAPYNLKANKTFNTTIIRTPGQ